MEGYCNDFSTSPVAFRVNLGYSRFNISGGTLVCHPSEVEVLYCIWPMSLPLCFRCTIHHIFCTFQCLWTGVRACIPWAMQLVIRTSAPLLRTWTTTWNFLLYVHEFLQCFIHDHDGQLYCSPAVIVVWLTSVLVEQLTKFCVSSSGGSCQCLLVCQGIWNWLVVVLKRFWFQPNALCDLQIKIIVANCYFDVRVMSNVTLTSFQPCVFLITINRSNCLRVVYRQFGCHRC